MSVPQPAIRQRHPDEWWVNAGLWGMGILFVGSVALVLAPIFIAAGVTYVVVRTTSIKWWWLAIASLVTGFVLHLVGLNPWEAIEGVMRKATRIAENKGFEVAARRIWNHKNQWWLRSLPALPIGVFIGSSRSPLGRRIPHGGGCGCRPDSA